ncbi:hypothetical protein B0H63DRAFT_244928 [Podospora didyma]|uniref:Uncharacterized protein n=1 Tax=Podospora didyma TaxID=330526 RepID=A0AAE0KKB3_9PEZI|nr:hypothetical protein B0H63DRAFT_244928 [Podospora didyma]
MRSNEGCQLAVMKPGELLEGETHLLHTYRHLSPEERWFQLWDQLFTGWSRPTSAFVKDGINEVIDLLSREGEQLIQNWGRFHRYPPALRYPPSEPIVASPAPPKGSDELGQNIAVTDSGYGPRGSSGKEAQEKLPRIPQIQEFSGAATEENLDDTASDKPDAQSTRDESLLQSVLAFVDELYGSLPLGFDRVEFQNASPALGELLRAFAPKAKVRAFEICHILSIDTAVLWYNNRQSSRKVPRGFFRAAGDSP